MISRHIHDDIFKQKLRERLWKIEGVMNELKNFNGLVRANYRGIENIQIQAYMEQYLSTLSGWYFLYSFYRALKRSKYVHLLQQAGTCFITNN